MPFYKTLPLLPLCIDHLEKVLEFGPKNKGHGNWRLILASENLAIGEWCCVVLEDDNALVLKWNAISASNPDRWLGRYQTAA